MRSIQNKSQSCAAENFAKMRELNAERAEKRRAKTEKLRRMSEKTDKNYYFLLTGYRVK